MDIDLETAEALFKVINLLKSVMFSFLLPSAIIEKHFLYRLAGHKLIKYF